MDPLEDGPEKQKETRSSSLHAYPTEFRPWTQADLSSNPDSTI